MVAGGVESSEKENEIRELSLRREFGLLSVAGADAGVPYCFQMCFREAHFDEARH